MIGVDRIEGLAGIDDEEDDSNIDTALEVDVDLAVDTDSAFNVDNKI